MGAWGFAGVGVSMEVAPDLGIVAGPVSMPSFAIARLLLNGHHAAATLNRWS